MISSKNMDRFEITKIFISTKAEKKRKGIRKYINTILILKTIIMIIIIIIIIMIIMIII